MSKVNKTTYAILGMLSIAPMSGYEMRQTMQQSTANFWSESDGQLYPTLSKLTKLALVMCKKDKTSTRDKKIYHLTTKGMTELKKWLAKESETNVVRSELMLKLFFGVNVAPEQNLEHIQTYRQQNKKMLAALSEQTKKLMGEHKHSPHLPYWQMTIQYGIALAQAKITWCDNITSKLQKLNRGKKS